MTNFKGTKGKWIQNGINGVYLESGMCIALTHSENRKANAVLMSKAPEMLDMLENLSFHFYETDSYPKIREQIEKLIKEATEL